MKSRPAERKPLSFSTTMRNPKRIVNFLNCLLPYENRILTHDVIMKIVNASIKEKLYKPMVINRTSELMDVYKSDDSRFSEEQIDFIVNESPQKHKEAGFDYGWDSRFDTIFKLPMEFGFVKYAMDKPIEISETGHMLIDAVNEEEPNEDVIQSVFLNSMIKYQSNNPYRKNFNNNAPLILLLQVLKLLKADKDENGAGVFRQELSLFICWPNNDSKKLYKRIKLLRATVGFSYSDEFMYEICLDLLGASDQQRNRFKLSQICGEAVDEYIRKMRTTGIISLRGNGRFVDYNVWEIKKIDYILEHYTYYKIFESKDEYFNYIGAVDTNIISMTSSAPIDTTDLRKTTLIKYATEYSKETIFSELHKVCNKLASTDYMLKLLPSPVRLEFLVSIAMLQNFDNLDVTPNYSIDDEGLPRGTALGGKADIVCFDDEYKSLIEVTLMCGRQEQVNNEIVPIRRHLIEEKNSDKNTFSVFIAPVIHDDTKEMARWYKHKDHLNILTYDMDDFIAVVQKINSLGAMLNLEA